MRTGILTFFLILSCEIVLCEIVVIDKRLKSIQELLTFDDLQGLDSSPEDVRGKFRDRFGSQPDGICVNDEGRFDFVSPTITHDYGDPSYKTLGKYEFTKYSDSPPITAVIGSNTALNYGDTNATIQLTVGGSWSQTTSVSSSITSGMKFSEEFGIEGIFKFGMEFSVSVTAGKSSSNSETRQTSSTVSVNVPPRSKVEVQMVATEKKETIEFKVPIDVTGTFGANFPDPVQGHYFWFLDCSQALPKLSGEITGEITGTDSMDFHTEIGKAEPL